MAGNIQRHPLFIQTPQVQFGKQHARLVAYRLHDISPIGADDRAAAAQHPVVAAGHPVGIGAAVGHLAMGGPLVEPRQHRAR